MPQAKPFIDRVSPEPNSGCWMWTGSSNPKGYGYVRHDGKTQLAHRVSYKLHVGPIPGGMFVCHKCDKPSCVNPDHLFLGTALDNARDKMAKGRDLPPPHKAGEANGKTKLTKEQVREIRTKRDAGQTGASVAREYGISAQSVSDIYHGKTWACSLMKSECRW